MKTATRKIRTRPKPTFDIEKLLFEKGYAAICGVDEVGRGPLAGPVVAAAVMWPAGMHIDGIDDSKKLSSDKRDELFNEIAHRELICAVGVIDNECIDRINIFKAALRAMRKAVTDLPMVPEVVLVDGKFSIPNLSVPQYAVVNGDGCCQSVMAASIVAKVTRDRIMDRYEALYPEFSFASHKGYSTAAHIDELRRNGPTDIHRRSFGPVAELLVEEYALV